MKASEIKKYLILLVGPTAVGKTALSIKLAKKFNTEIISSDSRQFYREMEIGTAKPTKEELAEAPHRLINTKSIHDEYDVKQFEKDALEILSEIFEHNNVAIMTGGSGLFADVITKGMDEMPEIPINYRKSVIQDYEINGLTFLQEEVEKIDPAYFQQVDKRNPQRLMRALEVFRATGKTFSSFRTKNVIHRPFQIIPIALSLPREQLYERINKRMDQMISEGLFEEAEKLFPFRHLNALQTVGYSEIFEFINGAYDREETIRLLKRNSRRYAKRQLTWFKKDNTIQWFSPLEFNQIVDCIVDQMD